MKGCFYLQTIKCTFDICNRNGGKKNVARLNDKLGKNKGVEMLQKKVIIEKFRRGQNNQ